MATLFVLGLACCAVTGGCGAAESQTTRDGELVRCLTDPGRRGVVEAAVVLGVVRESSVDDEVLLDGETLTLEQWMEADQDAFDRSCQAYLEATTDRADSGEPSPWVSAVLTTLLSLLVAVVTAVVGGAVTVWITGRDRRYHLARELREAAYGLMGQGQSYAAEFRTAAEKPGPDDLLRAREALETKLLEVQVARPRWRRVGALREELVREPLADDLMESMINPSRTETENRLVWVERTAAHRGALALRLAEGIENPLPAFRWLRGRKAPAGSVDRGRT